MFNPISRRLMMVGCLLMVGMLSLMSLSANIPLQAAEGMTATPSADAERRADEAMSLYWAASARLSQKDNDPFTALALALEANRIPNPPDQSVRALETVAYGVGPRRILAKAKEDSYWIAAFGPDGKSVVAGNQAENRVQLYDVVTGKTIRDFGEIQFGFSIHDLAFSPDGKRIAAALYDSCHQCDFGPSLYQLILWDVHSGEQLWKLDELTAQGFFSPTFSPDGTQIITFDYTNDRFNAWDVQTGTKIYELNGNVDDPFTGRFALSPDGRQIAASTKGGMIILWNVDATQIVARFPTQLKNTDHLLFGPDGKKLLASGNDGHAVLIETTKKAAEPNYFYSDATGYIMAMAFSTDGQTFFTHLSDGSLIEWDPTNETRLRTTQVIGRNLGFSPDVQHFLSDVSGSLVIWDVEDGEVARRYKGLSDSTDALAFSPDGRRFVSGGDYGLVIWDTVSGDKLIQIENSSDYPFDSIVFSPDGNTIATLDTTGLVYLWNADTGKLRYRLDRLVNSVAFSPDSQYLLTTSDEGQLILWRLESGREIQHYVDGSTSRTPIEAVLSPNGAYILERDTDRDVILWDADTRKIIKHLPKSDFDLFSPDGRSILHQDQDYNMVLSDLKSGDVLIRIPLDQYTQRTGYGNDVSRVYVAFSPDGQYVLVNSYDHLKLLDIHSGEIFRKYPRNGHSATFSPDGRYILTQSDSIRSDKGFLIDPGLDLVLLRVDNAEELIAWTLANRAVGTLTCDQRAYYRIEPYCDGQGTLTPS